MLHIHFVEILWMIVVKCEYLILFDSQNKQGLENINIIVYSTKRFLSCCFTLNKQMKAIQESFEKDAWLRRMEIKLKNRLII